MQGLVGFPGEVGSGDRRASLGILEGRAGLLAGRVGGAKNVGGEG